MATSFPAGLDSFTTLVDNVDSIVAAHPNDRADAIEALQDKVGVDDSSVVTSHDYKFTHLPAQAQDWDIGNYDLRAKSFTSDVITGTAPLVVTSTTVVANLNVDQVDGKDAPTGDIVGTTDTQTLTNKTLTSPTINTPTIGTSIALPAGAVDAITEIATAVKSGADATLVTGTKGTSGNLAQWNADGDLVDSTKSTTDLTQSFGSWVNKSSSYAAQQASTDGFVMCNIIYSNQSDSEEWVTGYTDGNANPTTARARCATGKTSTFEGYIRQNSFLMPVRSGDYWKVVSEGNNTPTIAVYWIPLS